VNLIHESGHDKVIISCWC